MQLVRYLGLYARNVKRKCAELAQSALEALRAQLPLLVLEPLVKFFKAPKWRELSKRVLVMIPSPAPAVDGFWNSPRFGNPNAATSG